MTRLASICLLLLACSTGTEEETQPQTADKAPMVAHTPVATEEGKIAIGKAKTAIERGKETIAAAGQQALTREAYEKLVLGLEACTLSGYSIDSKCPGAVALQDAMKGTSTSVKDLLGWNAQLGEKLIGHASPAVRVKAAELMASLTGTAGASQDAIVTAAAKETDPAVLQAFIRVVSNDGAKNPRVAALLLKSAEHADMAVRLQAIYAISSSWNREMPGGAEKLAKLAESDADVKVRAAACEYGGKLGNKVILPPMERATAKAIDKGMYTACMAGMAAMFHQYPFFETHDEGAYKLFLKRLDARPRTQDSPPWNVMSVFRYFSDDAKLDKVVAWKKQATWFKVADVKKALASVVADKQSNWMARTGAIESLVGLGATKAELELLKKGYDVKDGNDSLVLKKLDEAAAKAK